MTAKRTLFGAALLGCTLFGIAHAEAPDKLPKPTSYVSDFAGVIDAASKEDIEQIAWQVYSKAHATIEVVTVNSLDGQDIDQWTTTLEDTWKVGPKASDHGILMVFAIKDHKDRIEVGYGLEGILPDAKVGDIRRSMHDALIQGQYGPGIQSGVQQIASVIAADANVAITSPQQTEAPVYQYRQIHHRTNWVGIVFFVIFILLMFRGGGGGRGGWLWFLLGSMMGGGGRGGFGGGGGGFGGGDGGSGGGGDFGGGFGGGSGGGGASGDF